MARLNERSKTKFASYRLTVRANGSASAASQVLYQVIPGAANSAIKSNPPVTSTEWMQFGDSTSAHLREDTSSGLARRSNSTHKMIRSSLPLLPCTYFTDDDSS